MRNAVVILARGGSKGVPKKNLHPLAGKPLMYHALQAAHDSLCHEVWISTDCSEISTAAVRSGTRVKVHTRASDLALDDTPSEMAMIEFAFMRPYFKRLCFVQPTSPLITPEIINRGLNMLTVHDSVVTCYRDHGYWWKDGKPDMIAARTRQMRQDATPLYRETGMAYFINRHALLEGMCRYTEDAAMLEVPKMDSVDIDTLEDFELVEAILKWRSDD
jgi:CMP-N,N'-diacetyllegionaminic acid synthase